MILFSKKVESRNSPGATEKLPGVEKPHANTVAWSFDMEGHAKKYVERNCELANKMTEKFTKSQLFAWMTISSKKKEELETVGNLSEECSQIVFKNLSLERSGRPDILWSVNNLARAVTKWSFYSQHKHYRQCCHVGHTTQHCRLGLFQDWDFADVFEESKKTSGGILCVFKVEHSFPSVGCARNKRQCLTLPQNRKLFR